MENNIIKINETLADKASRYLSENQPKCFILLTVTKDGEVELCADGASKMEQLGLLQVGITCIAARD